MRLTLALWATLSTAWCGVIALLVLYSMSGGDPLTAQNWANAAKDCLSGMLVIGIICAPLAAGSLALKAARR
jgi:hypothetical protein